MAEEITVVVHGVTYAATATGEVAGGAHLYMINAVSLKLPTFYATARDFTGLGAGIAEALALLDDDEEWVEATA